MGSVTMMTTKSHLGAKKWEFYKSMGSVTIRWLLHGYKEVGVVNQWDQ